MLKTLNARRYSVIAILLACTSLFAQDSIQFCKILPQSNTFLAVANNFKTIQRHQLSTFNLITHFDVEHKRLIAIAEDEPLNNLYGISTRFLYSFNLSTGVATDSVPLPADVTKLLNSNLEIIIDKQLIAYNPISNKLVVCTGTDLFILNAKTGELQAEHHLSSIPDCFYFLNNGTTLLCKLSLSPSIWQIDLQDGTQKELYTFERLAHFSLNKEQTKAIAVTQNNSFLNPEIVYFDIRNNSLKKTKSTKLESNTFTPHYTTLFYNSNLVINRTGYSYLEYINDADGSAQTLDFGLTIDGFDQIEYQFLLWNKHSVKLFNSQGAELGCLPTLSEYSHDFSSYVSNSNNTLPIIDSNITALYGEANNRITGNTKGDITINKQTYSIIYTPITALLDQSKNLVYVGGLSRCVGFDPIDNKFTSTFRGIEGVITHIATDKNANLVAFANQLGKVYIFKTDGTMVGVNRANSAIKNLTFKDEYTIQAILTDNQKQLVDIRENIEEYENKERQLLINTHHRKSVESCSFSPDGKQLLTSDMDGEIKLWDVQSLVVTHSVFIEDINYAIFSLDGSEILAYGLNTFYLLDPKTLKIKRELAIPPYYKNRISISDVAFISPHVAAFSEMKYGTVFYLNINSGDVFYAYTTPRSIGIYALAFNPQNNTLATYSPDSIRILEITAFKQLSAHAHSKNSSQNIYVKRELSFSPKCTKLLAEKNDDVIVYGLPNFNIITTYNKAQKAHFINEEEILVFTDVNKYAGEFELAKHNLTTGITTVVFTPSEITYNRNKHLSKIATYNGLAALHYSDGIVELINSKTTQTIRLSQVSLLSGEVTFNPKNGLIAASAANKTENFDWREASKKDIVPHNFRITTMQSNFEFSPNGTYYLKIYSNLIEVYNNDASELKLKLEGEFGSKLTFDPEEKWVLIWDFETVQKFSLETGKQLWTKTWKQNDEFIDNVLVNNIGKAIVLTRKNLRKSTDWGGLEKKQSYFLNLISPTGEVKEKFEIQAYSLGASTLIEDYLVFENAWGSLAWLNIYNKKIDGIRDLNQIEDIYKIPNQQCVLITNDEGQIRKVDINTKQVFTLPHKLQGEIRSIYFYKNYMLANTKQGKSLIWDTADYKPLVYFIRLTNNGYAFFTDSLYYTGTPSIAKAFFFKQNNAVYPFEQFDLLYNRPDKIISNVSNNSELIRLYAAAYNKRLINLGITKIENYDVVDLPAVNWTNTPSSPETNAASINLTYTAKAGKHDLNTLHVWVNNVPIMGKKGKSLNETNYSSSIQLDLNEGSNKIEIAATDKHGLESLHQSFLITHNPIAAAKTKLYIIALAVSDFDQDKNDLRYAVKDGRDFATAFSQNHNEFDTIEIDTLFDTRVNLSNLQAIKAKLKQTTVNDAVIVFVAGHGLLDNNYNFYYATPSCDFKNPRQGGIAYAEIEDILDNIPARKKLLLMDACHSGQVDRSIASNQQLANSNTLQGGRGVEVIDDAATVSLSNSFELMGELFINLERGSGTQVISAATGDGSALEHDDWNNGAFTHTILNGLRNMKCDSDENGKVSITELRNYVIPEVERLTNGLQRPTVRQENIEFDWNMW